MAECVYSLLKLISATSDFFQHFYWTAFNIMTCCSFLPESLCLFQHSFSLVVFLFDSSAFIVTQCNLYSFIVAHFVLWIAIYHCPSSAFLYMIRSKWSENGFQKLLKRLSNLNSNIIVLHSVLIKNEIEYHWFVHYFLFRVSRKNKNVDRR